MHLAALSTSCPPNCHLQALGLKPKAAPKQLKQPSLEKHEVDKLLSGGSVDADGAATIAEADKTKGLGFDSK